MTAERRKAIITKEMADSAQRRMRNYGMGYEKTLSRNTWVHFGTHGLTLHRIAEDGHVSFKHVCKWQSKTIKQINTELSEQRWRL